MSNIVNHQIRLAGRPVGLPKSSDWQFTEAAVPDLEAGQVLVKIHYISVDPAMRGWMNDRETYVPALKLGEVMRALTVGEVIASENPAFATGEFVVGIDGVQEYAISDGSALMKADASLAPLPAYLNSLGIAGLTAYCGLIEVGAPKAGETVVVSGAAGSVGAHVGQIAKIKGCRAVGIAGGARKCAFLIDELGFDAAIDYQNEDLNDGLARSCPDGIDVFFDNVGGECLDAALARINFHAHVVICGAISQYNNTTAIEGPANYLNLLIRSARLEGFIYFNWRNQWPEMVAELAGWLNAGKLNCPDDIVEGGVAAFPETLLRLFSGDNFGKLMIKVAA
ncbi:MAG: NADP-dependent oxidoreductase [Proteobacteria bacterium]|nr:NADP-dependent oxidoreductase [Pseudomonadota bacterium]MDA1354855.1 NADP-dependent oxidoreductase [Pseudomonadota bacterium]